MVIIDEIRDCLAPQICKWFGGGASLEPGDPELRLHAHSIFLRFPVGNSGSVQAVLVKLPRRPEWRTLQEAVSSDKLREAAREEYEILCSAWQAFTPHDTPGCCAIRPLAYLGQWNAIVTCELEARPLRDLLLRPQIALGGAQAWRELEQAVRRSALWLRVFHQRGGSLGTASFPKAEIEAEIETEIERLQAVTSNGCSVEPMRKALHLALAAVPPREVPVARLHFDYQCTNILTTPDGRIAAVDGRLRRHGPVYADLSTLITDPVTRKAQILSNGLFLRRGLIARYEGFVLQSYFESQPIPNQALALYCALAVLRKWAFDERKITRLSGPKRPLAWAVRPLARHYLEAAVLRYARQG